MIETNLPALHIEVTGSVTASNLQDFKTIAFSVFDGFPRELSTDQDFADAEKTIKWCKSVETKLKAAKDNAQGQMSSVDELFRTIDDVSNEARRLRLDYEKLVESRKAELRESVVIRGREAYVKYAASINAQIAPCTLPTLMPDFAGAIKGKRTIESIQNAVDTALANQKIAADSAAENIKANLETVRNAGNDLLFADIAALCLKDKELVAMTVKQRLADHKAAQDARAELEAQKKRVEQAEIQLSPTASSTTQHDDGKRITLGDVCRRLGITMTSEFVKAVLGVDPIETERASKLYTEAQFQQICYALAQHVSSVQAHHNI